MRTMFYLWGCAEKWVDLVLCIYGRYSSTVLFDGYGEVECGSLLMARF